MNAVPGAVLAGAVTSGNVPLAAASLVGIGALGAVKGVAGEGIANTAMNLPEHGGNWRAAAKDTWTNTTMGKRITDFRNRSAYSGSGGTGDSGGFSTDSSNDELK